MSDSNEITSIRSRREALLQAIVGLEDALAAPLGDGVKWRLRVAMAIDHSVARLDEHIKQTEGPGNILDEIRQAAPRLDRRVTQMMVDHERLEKAAHALQVVVAELAEVEGDELLDMAIELRNGAVEMLGQMTRHRQRGADLIYEAYQVDLGDSS